jgi:hypothetical protein
LCRNPTRDDPQKPVLDKILDKFGDSMDANATHAEKAQLELQQIRRYLQYVNKEMRETRVELAALKKQSEKQFEKQLEEFNSLQRSSRLNQSLSRATHKRRLDDPDPYHDPHSQYVLIPFKKRAGCWFLTTREEELRLNLVRMLATMTRWKL